MVLAHNEWSGSARAIIVTVIGWLTLIKGLLFLLLPAGVEAESISMDSTTIDSSTPTSFSRSPRRSDPTYGGFAPSRK